MAQSKPYFSFQFLGLKLELAEPAGDPRWILAILLAFFLALFLVVKPVATSALIIDRVSHFGKWVSRIFEWLKKIRGGGGFMGKE